MMKIETRIDPCEIDGKDVEGLPQEANQVIVRAHWNRNRWVVIEFRGRSVTFSAAELNRAIQNATNY